MLGSAGREAVDRKARLAGNGASLARGALGVGYEKPSVRPLRADDLEPNGPGGTAYEALGFSLIANMHTTLRSTTPRSIDRDKAFIGPDG